MTTDTTLSAADAVVESERTASRARWVVEKLHESITSALCVLDDAELDSAKAKLSERGTFYLEAAGEHLGQLRTRCDDMPEFTHDLSVHLNSALQSVTGARTLPGVAHLRSRHRQRDLEVQTSEITVEARRRLSGQSRHPTMSPSHPMSRPTGR
jgi:hypothetical protein